MAELLRMEGITKKFWCSLCQYDINLLLLKKAKSTPLGENGAGKYPDEYL